MQFLFSTSQAVVSILALITLPSVVADDVRRITVVKIVQDKNPCSKPGWYCFQNGQDWAGCDLKLGKVTNDQFKIVEGVRRCRPGDFMAALEA
ncbi:hypothetical protein FPQ18DRAFT_316348 [Pyronema domesticum]|nr:hypothetical protein FPQ18DRAFT_316348 [Pyronema domesticum]